MAHRPVAASPFIATIFLSAALVFLVQPMFARMMTPLLGGSPAVWNVSLVCFQASLLAGYAYAHWVAARRSIKTQLAIHTAVLAVAMVTLPFGVSGLLGSPDAHRPVLWLIGAFALSVAPVFIALSATAPLLQSWYGRSGRADAGDPYYLYAASNAGSLLGLAAYPLLLEPFLPLAVQTDAWNVGFCVAVSGLLLCGVLVLRRNGPEFALGGTGVNASVIAPAISWMQRLRWLALAFVPSSLLVGVTTHLSTDVAAAPFLWSPPLVLYIGSFVLVFSRACEPAVRIAGKALPTAVGLVLLSLVSRDWSVGLQIAADLCALSLAAIYCHGRMAQDRPPAAKLTEFYLIMAGGGVLGGAFNALLAPVLFNQVAEFPLMLVAVLAFLPGPLRIIGIWPATLCILAIGGVALAILARSHESLSVMSDGVIALLTLPVIALALGRAHKGTRLVCAGAAAFATLTVPYAASELLIAERSFFGTIRVTLDGPLRVMAHGTTLHGAERLTKSDPDGRPQPIFYYHEDTAIGQVFAARRGRGTVGVIGLGTGAVACHLDDRQHAIFYEIDPAVAAIAADPTFFTFLSSCGQNSEIVVGDGRLKVTDEAPGTFDILFLDAFSSDAIPAHLLTREALATFMERLDADGILALHVSNRHMDLAPIIARTAAAEGWIARLQRYHALPKDPAFRRSTSVVLLARKAVHLGMLRNDERWRPIKDDGGRLWTDDYTNILGAMLLKARE